MDEDGDSAGSHIRPDDADSNPFWQLYDAVHNFTDNQGIFFLDLACQGCVVGFV